MHKSIHTGATVVGCLLIGVILGTVVRFSLATATEISAKSAPTFTYRYHYIAEFPDAEKAMDQYGAEGWELVSVGPPEHIAESAGSTPVLKHLMVFKKRT
jgi:hypothetical protein